jgi:hypothetical protein
LAARFFIRWGWLWQMRRRMSRREGNSPSRIRSRFPDRAQLRGRLWDPMQTNPNTVMPPFGKHRILSSDEIELIIDYLYTQ